MEDSTADDGPARPVAVGGMLGRRHVEAARDPSYPSDWAAVWMVYVLAWIAFTIGFIAIRSVFQGSTVAESVVPMLQITAPAAVIGVGAVLSTRRLDWPPVSVPRFLLLHVLLAAGYSVLWAGSVSLIWGLRRAADDGSFQMVGFDHEILSLFLVFGLVVYSTITSVVYLVRTVRRLQDERERVARADALRARAQLEALQARVNPHFLFNALHSVLSLVHRAPGRAERGLESLGDLLRYATDGGKRQGTEEVSLGTELEMVRRYLELEKLRLGERLEIREAVSDDVLDARLPPLTIQPLVENAVEHGIAPRGEGGKLEMQARMSRHGSRPAVVVAVRDDGPGCRMEAVRSAEGTGLRLVRRRLELLYGDAASLEVESHPGEGFQARVRIPVEEDASGPRGKREPR